MKKITSNVSIEFFVAFKRAIKAEGYKISDSIINLESKLIDNRTIKVSFDCIDPVAEIWQHMFNEY